MIYMDHLVRKIPCVVEARKNGWLRYYCEQCQSETDWTEPSKKVVHHCGYVLSKQEIIFDGPRAEDGFVRYACEQCGGATWWMEPYDSPGSASYHVCLPNSAAIQRKVQAGTAAVPSGDPKRCNAGMLADAEILLMMVEKNESTAPELKGLVNDVLRQLPEIRTRAIQDERKANLETSTPIG